jgi:peroxiredoxin
MPAEITVELPPGERIGGLLRSQKGEPISGAEIILSISSNASSHEIIKTGLESILTDAQGRWYSSSLPANFQGAAFHISHPEYNSANYTQKAEGGSNAMQVARTDLLGGKAEFALEPRIRVSGLVLNDKGSPVTNVDISYRGPDRPRQRLRTDAAGRFSFLVNEPGKATLGFVPEGFAPEYRTVGLRAGMKPLEVRLIRGFPTKLRVRDQDGLPVEGASVYLSSWNTTKLISWQTKTDAQGRFTWTNAPVGGVTFSISKSDFTSRTVAIGVPAQGEVQVTLKKSFRVYGTALNATSREPLPVFDVTPGRRWFSDEPIRWDFGQQDRYKSGQFSLNLGEFAGGEAFLLLEAQGFLPMLSKPYKAAETYSNVFELRPAAAIKGTVQLAGGGAGKKASLLLAGPGDEPTLEYPAEFRRGHGNGSVGKANVSGLFSLEPRLNASTLFAATSQGFARARLSDVETSEKIVLRPWGKVTGTLHLAGKPAPNQFVALHSPEHPVPGGDEPPLSFLYRVRSDTKGIFAFEKVPPGEWRLSLYYRLHDVTRGPLPVSDGLPVTVKAGETSVVNFTPSGRTITGRVEIVNGNASEVDWLRDVHRLKLRLPGVGEPTPPDLSKAKTEVEKAKLAHKYSEASRAYWASEKGRVAQRDEHAYMLLFETNGSFRIENVPPGSYDLMIAPTDPSSERYVNEPIAVYSRKLEVRQDKRNVPLDLGTIKLELRPGLRIGKTAPAFKLKTTDGRPVQVEDFRGKHLLLHFWSTECEGNLYDLETLKGIASPENPGRAKVEVLGLSFDRNQKAAAAYVQGSETPWAQCLLGSSATKLLEAYGINSTGGVVLVTPDGRIASKVLHGDYIRYAFRKATAAN